MLETVIILHILVIYCIYFIYYVSFVSLGHFFKLIMKEQVQKGHTC